MASITPIVFTNRQGVRLFGILHTPEIVRSGDVALILLSPGAKMRVGPQGLYKRMSDCFVRMGIPVLRFDYRGLGDSEGELSEEFLKDVYNHVEVGRFVDDTVDAMDWMQKHCGAKRFVMSGLCGGAVTGLLAATRDRRVVGLLGLGMTPLLSSRAADPSKYFATGQLRHLRKGYVKNLTSAASWYRLLTLQTDYKVLWRSVTAPLRKRQPRAAGSPAEAQAPPDDSNPLIPPAFFDMLSSDRPMLLVYGGSDRLRWDFEEKFVAKYRARLDEHAGRYEVHVVEHANHVLTFQPWQQEMLEVSSQWISRHFLHA